MRGMRTWLATQIPFANGGQSNQEDSRRTGTFNLIKVINPNFPPKYNLNDSVPRQILEWK